MRELPYRGRFVEMTPALEVVFADQNRELELEFVSRDRSESVIFVYQTLYTVPVVFNHRASVLHLLPKGLDPQGLYRLEQDIEPGVRSGRALMASGLDIPLTGSFTGKIIVLKITCCAEPLTPGSARKLSVQL